MLGIDEHQTLGNPALIDALLDIGGDVDEGPAGGHIEPELFSVAFHPTISLLVICFARKSIGSSYQRNRSTSRLEIPGRLDYLRRRSVHYFGSKNVNHHMLGLAFALLALSEPARDSS
jgi:hypothetical protein